MRLIYITLILGVALVGSVAHIQIQVKDEQMGHRFLRQLRVWLTQTGWVDLVSISLEVNTAQSLLQLIPGEYQSNRAKKIHLAKKTEVAELEPILHRWLFETDGV